MITFGQFLSDNWALTAIGIIILIALLIVEYLHSNQGSKTISTQELVKQSNDRKTSIIDVRKTEEFNQGHIINSENIPAQCIHEAFKNPKFKKSSTMIIVCNAGMSAKGIAKLFEKNKFENVFVLEGGIKAWSKAKMPLVRS